MTARYLAVACLAAAGCLDASQLDSARKADMSQATVDIGFASTLGDSTSLSRLGGKAYLVVNVASECGFTPQYEGLEELYRSYRERGLVIVAFPCNQFGGQEPGTDADIREFCRLKFGVSFPLMAKVDVKGAEQHPLYRRLTRDSDRPGEIQWNFTKFLIAPDGRVAARFEPAVEPLAPQVREAVEQLI